MIAEQYRRMADHQLMEFAKNEARNLPIQSFHLLKAEFERRSLDIGIINEEETERMLAEATKMSEFEKNNADNFANSLWNFAVNQKHKGVTNTELFEALLKKGIDERHAYMLIESIPMRAEEIVNAAGNEATIIWIVMLVVIGANFMFDIGKFGYHLFIGVFLLIGGIAKLYRLYVIKSKFQKILQNIEIEREAQQKDDAALDQIAQWN